MSTDEGRFDEGDTAWPEEGVDEIDVSEPNLDSKLKSIGLTKSIALTKVNFKHIGWSVETILNWLSPGSALHRKEKAKAKLMAIFEEFAEGENPSSVQVNMLRQWLNEERIKDAKLFVTNEMIWGWLAPTPDRTNKEAR